MRKETVRKIVCDLYVIVLVLMSVVLMALTLYFRVNPVEGSVVDEAICGKPFHYVLLITTMPAWIAGVFLGGVSILSYPLMFIIQIAIYTGLGILLRWIHGRLARGNH